MILASIEGTIGAAVLALLMMAIRWIRNRSAERPAGETVEKYGLEKSPAALGAKSDSEEERMRRFLEALGIPTDAAAEERRPATPPPLRPAPRRESPVKPVPPIVAQPSPPRRVPPAVQRSAPPPIPKVEPRPEIKVPVATVQVGESRSHEGLEFHTRISAVPDQTNPAPGTTPSAQIDGQREASGRELWREALQSSEGLRSAFILREILAPPRGLQSNGIVPSFPSS